MKFNHAVKHNGVLYPAGAEVPVGVTPKVEPKAPEPVVVPKDEPKPIQEETPKPRANTRKRRK